MAFGRTPVLSAGYGMVEGFVVMRPPNETITLARRLRRNLSPPEARLWNRLRERMPGRPVFRRQHPIEPYVLDFYLRRGAACG
jgi:very-short-patch-repair endonuclease